MTKGKIDMRQLVRDLLAFLVIGFFSALVGILSYTVYNTISDTKNSPPSIATQEKEYNKMIDEYNKMIDEYENYLAEWEARENRQNQPVIPPPDNLFPIKITYKLHHGSGNFKVEYDESGYKGIFTNCLIIESIEVKGRVFIVSPFQSSLLPGPADVIHPQATQLIYNLRQADELAKMSGWTLRTEGGDVLLENIVFADKENVESFVEIYDELNAQKLESVVEEDDGEKKQEKDQENM